MTIYLNFVVIENCTFRNVEGPIELIKHFRRYHFLYIYIYISFAYLHCFSYFINFCIYLDREVERKVTIDLYIGEGFENRPFSYIKLIFLVIE
jgi:hypothetical protein